MKISAKRWAYVLQPLMTGVYAAAVLLMMRLDEKSTAFDSVSVCSLMVTSFVLFILPHVPSAKLRVVASGYVMSLITGLVAAFVLFLLAHHTSISLTVLHVIIGVVAIIFTIWLMIFFNGKHPPALGLTLGLSTLSWDTNGLSIVIIAVILVIVLKKILTPYLQVL